MLVELTIRRAGSQDADPAAELWLRARKAALGAIPPPVHSDEEVREWFGTYVTRELDLWVAESGAGIVGMLVLDGEWIDQLYVDPEYLGRGIGSRLLGLARRERPGTLRLWTFVSNTRARRFYEHHGFVEVARTDGLRNEERAPDIQYIHPGPPRGAARAGCDDLCHEGAPLRLAAGSGQCGTRGWGMRRGPPR
jgi:ribosomal protein S18 acetylase RimI-like enzyme